MKNIQEHLRKVEDDQALNGISRLDETQRDQDDRHYAVSQLIQPNIPMGWYNPSTGRYVLGYPGYFEPNSSYTTASQAALTLTCPTGHRYEVYYAGCRNATQASNATLSAVIGGNTFTDLLEDQGGGMIITSTIICIGTGGSITDAVGGTFAKRVPDVIHLAAGDQLVMTLSVYAAANNTEHLFLFKDYPV